MVWLRAEIKFFIIHGLGKQFKAIWYKHQQRTSTRMSWFFCIFVDSLLRQVRNHGAAAEIRMALNHDKLLHELHSCTMQCCKFWIHPRIKIIDCPKLFQDAVLILADTLQSCKFGKGHCMHEFQYKLPRVCLIKTSAVLYPVVRNGGQPGSQLALVLCDDRAMIGQPRGVVKLWINRNINRHPSKFRLTICAMTGTSCITRGAGKCPRGREWLRFIAVCRSSLDRTPLDGRTPAVRYRGGHVQVVNS